MRARVLLSLFSFPQNPPLQALGRLRFKFEVLMRHKIGMSIITIECWAKE